jgi:hypothetical protein
VFVDGPVWSLPIVKRESIFQSNDYFMGKPIDGADGEAIERLTRYMSRAPLSVERIHYHAEEQTVTVDAEKSQAGSRNWPVPEFFALLAAHIPCRYESPITYYGVYSSSHQGTAPKTNQKSQTQEERTPQLSTKHQ